MKFYIRSVNVQGFEMWEAINQDGDQIALAWSEGGARTKALSYNKTEPFDSYDFAQAVANYDKR